MGIKTIVIVTSDDFYSKIVIDDVIKKQEKYNVVIIKLVTSVWLKIKLIAKGAIRSPLYVVCMLYESLVLAFYGRKIRKKLNIERHQPKFILTDINSFEAINKISSIDSECILFVRPLQIIRRDFLKKFPFSYNLHNTVLPKYRGLGGIFQTLRHGDSEMGVTLFNVEKKIDAGPIALQHIFPLTKNYSIFEATLMSYLYARNVAVEFCEKIVQGDIVLHAQDEAKSSTYSWPSFREWREFFMSRYRLFGIKYIEEIVNDVLVEKV